MAEYKDYAAKVAAAMGTPEISDELIREHQATGIADYLCNEQLNFLREPQRTQRYAETSCSCLSPSG